MPQPKKPRVKKADVSKYASDIEQVLHIDELTDVDRFFAKDLSNDYGKWCAIADAAWNSMVADGLTRQHSSGAAGNVHHKMVKSECIDIYKAASAMKTQLAAKISKFSAQGASSVIQEEMDELDAFNS